jgi:hypothetical protein
MLITGTWMRSLYYDDHRHLDEELFFGRSSRVLQTLEQLRAERLFQLESCQLVLESGRLASNADQVSGRRLKSSQRKFFYKDQAIKDPDQGIVAQAWIIRQPGSLHNVW